MRSSVFGFGQAEKVALKSLGAGPNLPKPVHNSTVSPAFGGPERFVAGPRSRVARANLALSRASKLRNFRNFRKLRKLWNFRRLWKLRNSSLELRTRPAKPKHRPSCCVELAELAERASTADKLARWLAVHLSLASSRNSRLYSFNLAMNHTLASSVLYYKPHSHTHTNYWHWHWHCVRPTVVRAPKAQARRPIWHSLELALSSGRELAIQSRRAKARQRLRTHTHTHTGSRALYRRSAVQLWAPRRFALLAASPTRTNRWIR